MNAENGERPTKRTHRKLARKMAHQISGYWEARGHSVLYDHDADHSKIFSSFDPLSDGPETQLGQVDIAIVEKDGDHALALIVIEENTDEPTTILGALFGVLMGNQVSLRRRLAENRQQLLSTMILMGINRIVVTDGRIEARIDYLRTKIEQVSPLLGTGNSSIHKVCIETFSDEESLYELLTDKLDELRKQLSQ
jgi:hypothetical protein